jgi:hypothetical protein
MNTYTRSALGALITTVAGSFACSSGTSPSDGTGSGSGGSQCNPTCDTGSGSGGTTTTAGHDSNPDGVPYPSPSGGYGRTPRSGNTAGSMIQNFKFLGYPDGDSTQPLATISLADYYDPCNKRYKLLHITVAAVWCEPCNQETDALVAAKSALAQDSVVVIQALDDGPTVGTPATLNDLGYWIRTHNSNFTEMLDPGLQNLGGFFAASSIPWNCDIDPRTMEIIDSSEGWAGDVSTELQPGLSGLPGQPSYPLPVSCP